MAAVSYRHIRLGTSTNPILWTKVDSAWAMAFGMVTVWLVWEMGI